MHLKIGDSRRKHEELTGNEEILNMIHMKILPSGFIRVTVPGVFACGGEDGSLEEQEKLH